MTQIMWSKET